MEYMVVVWFITRLETVRVYTWHTPSKAEGAILLQSYYITAPETTGETRSCRRRLMVTLQCQGQWGEAAPLGKGSQEPRVTAGPAGEGLHWQGRRAGLLVATRASQESRWPDKPVGMRQVRGQACHPSWSRSTCMVMAATQLQWSLSQEQGWEPQLHNSSWAKEQQALTEISSSIFFQGYQLYYL